MEFKLPEIGEGVQEGEIIKWHAAEGTSLKREQPLVEVMTDKASVEIVVPFDCTVKKHMVAEGKMCKVHGVLAILETAAGAVTSAAAPAKSEKAAAPAASAPSAAPAVSAAPAAKSSGEVTRAFPATRKLAREMGVDLGSVAGSGPDGRVTKQDILTHQPNGSHSPASTNGNGASVSVPVMEKTAIAKTALEERIPVRGVRRSIVKNMVISKQHAPHFTIFDECDYGALVEVRTQLKEIAAQQGAKLTYLTFLVKAAIAALKKHPMLNCSYDEAAEEIVLKKFYNIGIAVATTDGLVVPVVKDADKKSLIQIAKEIEMLAKGARDKKLAPADYQHGTFTITNIGSIGGMFATPIINYPEVAIMGVNRIVEKPVVKNGQVVVRPMSFLNVTCDHRIVDGATAAEFLNTLMSYITNPQSLMLEMN